MIFPGETFQHKFILPFAAENITSAQVTYMQMDEIIASKKITTFTEDENDETKCDFVCTFTQRETLKFHDNIPVDIQINVYQAESGSTPAQRYTSCIMHEECGRQTYREIIDSENDS